MDQAHALMQSLFDRYVQRTGDAAEAYMLQHARPSVIARQIQSCRMYLPHVSGRTLDWGCHHAPDSCLIRHFKGAEPELYGCDAPGADYASFVDFFDYAGVRFTELAHPYQLPYGDGFFDTVVSSGVLEHAPNDYESIKEIHRVLKSGGHFVITFLPNRYSYTEALSRWLGRSHHERTYALGDITRRLRHAGFRVLDARYFLMVPTILPGAERLWGLNPLLERLWPINRLSSNLLIVAQKRDFMQ